MTIDRGNVVSVLFVNDSDEERRLTVYAGTVTSDSNGTTVKTPTQSLHPRDR